MLAIFFWLSTAYASDFKITAPPQWQEIVPANGFREFRNAAAKTDERVILFAQDGEDFTPAKRELEEVRRGVFEAAGLRGYVVKSVEPRAGCLEIQSAYLAAREIQVLERRCFSGARQTHAFFLREGAALNEIARARAVLDNFLPYSSRLPASETAVTDSAPPTRLLSEESARDKICARVPAERRRSPGQTNVGRAAEISLLGQANCLRGAVADNLWDLVKSTAEYNWAILKYRFSPAYRNEVNATAAIVAAEVRRDASGFVEKIAVRIAEATRDSGVEFLKCLSASEQIRVSCKIIAGLLPGGLLAKIGSKAPLALEEAAQVAKIVREAIDLPPPARYLELPGDRRLVLPPKVERPLGEQVVLREAPTELRPATVAPAAPTAEMVPTEALPRVGSAPQPVKIIEIPPPDPVLDAALRDYPERVNRMASIRDGTYYRGENAYWRQWNNPSSIAELPPQSWKLHVGVKPEKAAELAEVLLPELRGEKAAHKVVAELDRYSAVDSDHPQYGKFLTIYTRNDEEAAKLAKLVSDILARKGFKPDDFIKPPNEEQFYPGVTGRVAPNGERKLRSVLEYKDGRWVPAKEQSREWIELPDGRVVQDTRELNPIDLGFKIPR